MARYYLLNRIKLVNADYLPGAVIDTAVGDPVADIQAAGGLLVPDSNVKVAAAAQLVLTMHNRGATPESMGEVMQAAYDDSQEDEIAAGGADITALQTDVGTAQTTANNAVPKASVQTGMTALVAGTVTVATANITTASKVVPIRDVAGANPGNLSVSAVTPGTPGSFTIDSANALDDSTVRWLVIG